MGEMEEMTVSARTRKSDMHEVFLAVHAADCVSPPAGSARAD